MALRISISSGLLDDLYQQAAASPAEVCGLLFGTGDRIIAAEPVANVAADPARFFELDPARLFAAQRAMRSGGPRVVGWYHSHPTGIAAPSDHDRAGAAGDGMVWLIVTGREARLWQSDAPGSLVPVTLDVIPPLE